MKRPERVLFVDDDSSVRRAFARAMRQQGFIVDVAASGEEALGLAAQYPYAVVATDQRMPGMDGLLLVEHLKLIHPDSTFLLVTGETSLPLDREVGTAAIENVIAKPWDKDELANALASGVTSYLKRRETKQAPPSQERPNEQVILLLTDTPGYLEVVTQHLPTGGNSDYLLKQVSSVSEALESLRLERFVAVLADVSLLETVGISAVSHLEALATEAPLVILASAAQESQAVRAVQLGALDFLIKEQLDSQALGRTIRYAIDRKHSQGRLAHLAHYDQLTGLANRSLLRERLLQALCRAQRHETRIALLMIDVDRFKGVNDSLGHDAGDKLLQEVAQRLSGSVRDGDTVARFGGDEFAIILEDLDASDGRATLLAARVLNSFATPVDVNGSAVSTSPSIGIAFYPDNAASAEELLKRAGSALQRAKEHGRNNYQFFSEEMHARVVERLRLEAALARAVQLEEFVVHYQPQLDVLSGRVLGVEALLRWQRPDGSLTPPGAFIPPLEETGLIVPVGEWVLRSVCRQLREWSDAGLPELRAAVNVSARQFEDAALADIVRQAVRDADIPGHWLELELTESTLLRDMAGARRTLCELTEMGVRVAIDDFGTGYSSLRYLKLLPINTLKIDRSFIQDITIDQSDRAIATAIISLAHALDLEVIAEGVETADQLEFLRLQKCDSVQGFFFARPASASVVTRWLFDHSGARSTEEPPTRSSSAPSAQRRTSERQAAAGE